MFASQALSQESNKRKEEKFVPFTPTHPDLPLALGHKPGRICELSLVLGKGLDAAGELGKAAMGRAQLRWVCQPLILVAALL